MKVREVVAEFTDERREVSAPVGVSWLVFDNCEPSILQADPAGWALSSDDKRSRFHIERSSLFNPMK